MFTLINNDKALSLPIVWDSGIAAPNLSKIEPANRLLESKFSFEQLLPGACFPNSTVA